MAEVLGAAVDPLVAVQVYLTGELAGRGHDIHIGVTPPAGNPDQYILINPGNDDSPTRFTSEHVTDLVWYDRDAVRVGLGIHLVKALLLSVHNTPVETVQGRTYLLAGRPDFGPVDYDDPDVPLFGRRLGVRLLMSNSII